MSITNIILIVVALIIIWAVISFNSLVRLGNRTKEAWSDIDIQLKRRYDLIPNLMKVVAGYAAHESGTFEKVTAARNAAMEAKTTGDKSKAENALAGTLKSLFAVAEAYPELKANQNFLSLQTELSDTENKIQAARRFYNGNVRDLNTAIEVFPTNMMAGTFGFKKMDLFDLGDNDAAQQPVEVKF